MSDLEEIVDGPIMTFHFYEDPRHIDHRYISMSFREGPFYDVELDLLERMIERARTTDVGEKEFSYAPWRRDDG